MHKPTPTPTLVAVVPATRPGHRAFAPVAFGGSSRLTFRRLRRPTPLPTLSALPTFAGFGGFGGYLGRLNWLFGSR